MKSLTTVRAAVGLAATFLATSVISQDQKELGSLQDFTPWFMATCGRMIGSITANSQYEAVLEKHPVNAAQTCMCASATVLGDEKLQQNLTGSEQELQARLQQTTLSSYFALRITSATLACLAADLDKSLSASSLPK